MYAIRSYYASGTTSIKFGVTRDKVLQLKTILSDGSEAVFNKISTSEFNQKRKENSLEGKIYDAIYNELSNEEIQQEIIKEFPRKSVITSYSIHYTKLYDRLDASDRLQELRQPEVRQRRLTRHDQ